MGEEQKLSGIGAAELRRMLDEFNAADEACERAQQRLNECQVARRDIGHQINQILLRRPHPHQVAYAGRLYVCVEGVIDYHPVDQI